MQDTPDDIVYPADDQVAPVDGQATLADVQPVQAPPQAAPPEAASADIVYPEAPGTWQSLANSAERGARALYRDWQDLPGQVQGMELAADLQRRIAAGEDSLWTRRFIDNPELLETFRGQYAENVAASAPIVAEQNRLISALPQHPAAEAMQRAQTWSEAWDHFASAPLSVIANIGLESLVRQSPSLAVGAVAGAAGGVPALMAAIGLGSAHTEYMGGIFDALTEAGVDITNADALRQALSNPELMKRIRHQSAVKAGVVGAFDAASGGLASRVLLPATTLAARPVARHLTNVGVQIPTQGAMGGAGEALGSVASGQEVRPGAVMGEIVGEAFGAPAEVLGARSARRRQPQEDAAPPLAAEDPVPLVPSAEPAQPQAAISGFYAPAERAIETSRRVQGPAQAWFNDLKKAGVSNDELDWMGFPQWMEENRGRPISRDEVAEFVRENEAVLEETRQEGTSGKTREEIAFEQYGLPWDQLNARQQFWAQTAAGQQVKFANNFPAGVTNPRNFLVRMPGLNYESPHFGGPVISFIRTADVVGPNGERTLLVHGNQSELHQEAEKGGGYYQKSDEDAFVTARDFERVMQNQLTYSEANAVNEVRFGGANVDNQYLQKLQDLRISKPDAMRVVDAYMRLEGHGVAGAMPNAPLKGDRWWQLGLKLALRQAVAEGYDAVAISTADQVKATDGNAPKILYDSKMPSWLSKYVKPMGGEVTATDTGNGRYMPKPFASLADITAAFGRDVITKRSASGFSWDVFEPGRRTIFGRDTGRQVGTIVKGLDGVFSIGSHEPSLDRSPKFYDYTPVIRPVVRITPQMRESISKGQPLFSAHNSPSSSDQQEVATDTVADGGTYDVPIRVADGILGELRNSRYMSMVPPDYDVGSLIMLESVNDGNPNGEVNAVFLTVEDNYVSMRLPLDKLNSLGAIHVSAGYTDSGRGGVFFLRFDLPGEFGKRLAGELRHEAGHALRSTGKLSGKVWERLLGHARSLDSMGMSVSDYLFVKGDRYWQNASQNTTVNEAYTRLYDGRPDFQEVMDQEHVMIMLELHHHGYFSDEQMAPIRDILDAMESGAVARGEGVASSAEPAMAIAGVRAKGADVGQLDVAKTMAARKIKPEAIWKKTGWYVGPDGKWRFEIDDSNAKLTVNTAAEADSRYNSGFNTHRQDIGGRLGDIIDHRKLFDAYPALRELSVFIGLGDYYSGSGSGINQGYITVHLGDEQRDQVLPVLLHEIQHWIQETEGFEPGSAPKFIAEQNQIVLNDIDQELSRLDGSGGLGHNVRPYLIEARDAISRSMSRLEPSWWGPSVGAIEAYNRIYGEVEARNVMSRAALTEAARRESFPPTTMDVTQPTRRSSGTALTLQAEDVIRRAFDAAGPDLRFGSLTRAETYERIIRDVVEDGAAKTYARHDEWVRSAADNVAKMARQLADAKMAPGARPPSGIRGLVQRMRHGTGHVTAGRQAVLDAEHRLADALSLQRATEKMRDVYGAIIKEGIDVASYDVQSFDLNEILGPSSGRIKATAIARPDGPQAAIAGPRAKTASKDNLAREMSPEIKAAEDRYAFVMDRVYGTKKDSYDRAPNGLVHEIEARGGTTSYGRNRPRRMSSFPGPLFAIGGGGNRSKSDGLYGVHYTTKDFDKFIAAPKRDPGYWGRGIYMFPREYAEKWRGSESGISYGIAEIGQRSIPIRVESVSPFYIDQYSGPDRRFVFRGDFESLKNHGWPYLGAPLQVWGNQFGSWQDIRPTIDVSKEREEANRLEKVWRDLARGEPIRSRSAKKQAAVDAAHEAYDIAGRKADPEAKLAEQFTDALLKAGYDSVVLREDGKPYEMVAIKPGTVTGQYTGDIMFAIGGGGPVSLVSFIRAQGGIRDERGELAAILDRPGSKGYIPGIINNKTGVHPDRMRERLVEAGYLRESGPDQPAITSVNDVYDLVRRAYGGERVLPIGEYAEPVETRPDAAEIINQAVNVLNEAGMDYYLTEAEEARVVELVSSGVSVDDAIERATMESVDGYESGGREEAGAVGRRDQAESARRSEGEYRAEFPGDESAWNAGAGEGRAAEGTGTGLVPVTPPPLPPSSGGGSGMVPPGGGRGGRRPPPGDVSPPDRGGGPGQLAPPNIVEGARSWTVGDWMRAARDKWYSLGRTAETWWNPINGLPQLEQYRIGRYRMLGRIGHGEEMTKLIWRDFKDASKADKQAAYTYLTTRGASETAIVDPKVRHAALASKRLFNALGVAAVERGLISSEALEKYRDRYLPRLYLEHILRKGSMLGFSGNSRPSDLGWTKHRSDIDKETRVLMGEILDPGYLAARGIFRMHRDMQIIDFLSAISENDDWVFARGLAEFNGKRVSPYFLRAEAEALRERAGYEPDDGYRAAMVAMATDMETAAAPFIRENEDVPNGYKQIPDTKRYGMLRGMYVRREIADDLLPTMSLIPEDANWYEKFLSPGGAGGKFNALWKAYHVPLNPSTQLRNIMSNAIMMNLSGMGAHRVAEFLGKAIKQMATNGPIYKIAVDMGLKTSGFSEQELRNVSEAWLKAEQALIRENAYGTLWYPWQIVKHVHDTVLRKAGDLYNFSDGLFKVAMMIDAVERQGMTPEQGFLHAQKWLFDYSDVSKAVRYLRSSPVGIPFASYYYKALPRIIETAATKPWRFLPYVILPYMMGQLFMHAWDAYDDDEDKRRNPNRPNPVNRLAMTLPEYLRSKDYAFIMPGQDARGRWQFFDFGYLLPWSMFHETVQSAGKGEITNAMRQAGFLGGPLLSLYQFIASKGTDSFTGRKVIDPRDPPSTQIWNTLGWMWDQTAPPLLTSRGALAKLRDAYNEVPERSGDPGLTMAQAVLRLFGLNVYPVDPDTSRGRQISRMVYEIKEAEKRRRSILRDQSLSPEARQRENDIRLMDIVRRRRELHEYRTNSEVHPRLRTWRPQPSDVSRPAAPPSDIVYPPQNDIVYPQ